VERAIRVVVLVIPHVAITSPVSLFRAVSGTDAAKFVWSTAGSIEIVVGRDIWRGYAVFGSDGVLVVRTLYACEAPAARAGRSPVTYQYIHAKKVLSVCLLPERPHSR
jgi:hypothetical protein